jgi:uncharacterized membrane protein YdjX (TVP38/TMEM64 family)
MLAAALVLFGRLLPLEEGAQSLQGWLSGLGPWGPLAYVGVYVLAAVAGLPGTPLTLLGGAVFGPLVGTVVVSAGSTVGAALAFLVARHLARGRVSLWVGEHPRYAALDGAIRDGGWRIVVLLRLSPLVPFNLQNYLYGLTPIPFWPCVGASWAAMLPGTLLYVLLGHATGSVVRDGVRSPIEWLALAVGLAATVVVTIYVTRLARRRLAEVVVSDETPASDAAEQAATASGRGSRALFALSLLALLSAVGLTLAPGCASSLLTRLFGPPQVELGESYAERPDGPTVDHAAFDAMLRAHVDADGWVDYAGLQAERAGLQAYLAHVGQVDLAPLGRDERLALLINAYNAATLELILDHRIPASIRDIPGDARWDAVRWTVGGTTYSLNQLEHEQIRPHFREPRIHFALVCAAASCPPLRGEAFTGARLEAQLAAQAEYVHRHLDWYAPDADLSEVGLTALYQWYGGDFEQVAGSVLEYVAGFDAKLGQALQAGNAPGVRFLDYDWALNDVANKRERALNGLTTE